MNGDVVWFHDRILNSETARVSVSDFGLLYGDGLFETMRSDGGVAYLDRHLARLRSAANRIDLPLPEEEALRRGLQAVLKAMGGVASRIRLTVTRGAAGAPEAPETVEPTFWIVARPAPPPPVGWTAAWATFPRDERNPIHSMKTTSYLPNVLSRREARRRGADEALFRNQRGDVAEGSATNLFVTHGDRLRTPPETAGILPGVMRSVLLERAGSGGWIPEESHVEPAELISADGVFLTNAVIGVVPLSRIMSGTGDSLAPESISIDSPRSEQAGLTERLRSLIWRPEDFE